MAENNTQMVEQQQTAEAALINKKNTITSSVLKRIASLEHDGGINIPKGFSAGNQINLAMLKLSQMKDAKGRPVLSYVSGPSVANALLNMCILGLSLEKGQCAFIPYGDELQFQVEYHGKVALAKRLGGAGEPQAQVIYEGDIFEYNINPLTGKKVIVKHEQKLQNIANDKIVGAWCIIPYANHPEIEPKVEIMTMAEIRQSWMQGATKGQSPAHRNFAAEMVKKTIIARACKLFISTSDDAGIYDTYAKDNDVDIQEPQDGKTPTSAMEAVFEGIQEPSRKQVEQPHAEKVNEPTAAASEAQEENSEQMMNDDFFNA